MGMGEKMKVFDLKTDKFKTYVEKCGVQFLEPTNEYELIRFNAKNGIGIVYQSRRGYTLTGSAILAYEFFKRNKRWVAGYNYQSFERPEVIEKLIERDGDCCFYCASKLESDSTVEHILSKAHGGNDNEANLCLVHRQCNRSADCLPITEKIRMFFKRKVEA